MKFLLLSIFANLWIFTIQDIDPVDPPELISQCSIYEVLSNCAPPNIYCGRCCPLPFQLDLVCVEMCVTGCVCKPGFIRHAGTGRCVGEGLCPAPGDNNAVYSRCAADEQVYCPVFPPLPLPEESLAIKPKPCICDCIPGFVCKPGYAKNSTGYCVPYEECDGIITEK